MSLALAKSSSGLPYLAASLGSASRSSNLPATNASRWPMRLAWPPAAPAFRRFPTAFTKSSVAPVAFNASPSLLTARPPNVKCVSGSVITSVANPAMSHGKSANASGLSQGIPSTLVGAPNLVIRSRPLIRPVVAIGFISGSNGLEPPPVMASMVLRAMPPGTSRILPMAPMPDQPALPMSFQRDCSSSLDIWFS